MIAKSAPTSTYIVSNRPEFETPAPIPTGAYILVFDEDVKPTVAERKIRNATGIRTAQSKDFASDPEFITKAFEETNGAMFTDLGMAVVRPDDAGAAIATFAAMQEVGDVIEYAPEFYLFTDDDLQRQYEYWVRDGLRILADLSTSEAKVLRLPAPETINRREEQAARVVATNMTWGLEAIGVPGTGTRYDGAGVRLCVLDTGIDVDHVDFRDREIHTASFIDGETVQDGHGHGTHCAGTAAGAATPASGGCPVRCCQWL